MLDKVGRGVDNPWHQNLVRRDFVLTVPEHRPLMGVAGIGCFKQNRLGLGPHQRGKDRVHINIATMGALVIAPANVDAHFIRWHILQCVVQHLHMHVSDLDEFSIRKIGEQHVP